MLKLWLSISFTVLFIIFATFVVAEFWNPIDPIKAFVEENWLWGVIILIILIIVI